VADHGAQMRVFGAALTASTARGQLMVVLELAGVVVQPGGMDVSDQAGAAQYHFDPATCRTMMLAEVPAYRDLQRHVAQAITGIDAGSILELGAGTGETAAAVLAVHPAVGGPGSMRTSRCSPGLMIALRPQTCGSSAWKTRSLRDGTTWSSLRSRSTTSTQPGKRTLKEAAAAVLRRGAWTAAASLALSCQGVGSGKEPL
jgi:hypothetical protein